MLKLKVLFCRAVYAVSYFLILFNQGVWKNESRFRVLKNNQTIQNFQFRSIGFPQHLQNHQISCP